MEVQFEFGFPLGILMTLMTKEPFPNLRKEPSKGTGELRNVGIWKEERRSQLVAELPSVPSVPYYPSYPIYYGD